MEERRRVPLTIPTADPHVCTPDVRHHVLGKVPFFAGLDHDQLHQVGDLCRVRGLTAGESVYLEGDPATQLYVVATGAMKTTRVSPEGRETLLDLLFPGDFLGSYPTQGAQEHADSAWAVTPTCLLSLDAGDFSTILRRFPSVALATLEGVSKRLSQSQDAVHRLSAAPVEKRLAATLLLVAEKIGEPWHGDGVLLQVPLSREDLASMTGAVTETASRILSQWRRDGLIDTGRRWVAIKDVAALERVRDGN